MELRHLRYFIAVAEEENIHRAAKRLHISQPPLSLAIQQLEHDIGAPLFLREGRGISITKAGEDFLIQAKEILNAVNKASHRAHNIANGVEGILKIGFVSSAVSGILQKSVSRFKTQFPHIGLELLQSNNTLIPQQLMSNEIDIGILRLPEDIPSGLKINYQEKEGWCAALPESHPLAQKRSLNIKALAEKPLIFYPRQNSPKGYHDIINLFRSYDITPHIVQEATEQTTIAALVVSGVGIGIVPSCMANIKFPSIDHVSITGTQDKTALAVLSRNKTDILTDHFLSILT